eukprot:COSAG02_NODE_15297_length_1183_cov_3.537823_1_plen_140_part_01
MVCHRCGRAARSLRVYASVRPRLAWPPSPQLLEGCELERASSCWHAHCSHRHRCRCCRSCRQAPVSKPKSERKPKTAGDESAGGGAPSYEAAEESSEDEGPQFNLKEYEAQKAAERAALPTLTKSKGGRTVTADDGLQEL